MIVQLHTPHPFYKADAIFTLKQTIEVLRERRSPGMKQIFLSNIANKQLDRQTDKSRLPKTLPPFAKRSNECRVLVVKG